MPAANNENTHDSAYQAPSQSVRRLMKTVRVEKSLLRFEKRVSRESLKLGQRQWFYCFLFVKKFPVRRNSFRKTMVVTRLTTIILVVTTILTKLCACAKLFVAMQGGFDKRVFRRNKSLTQREKFVAKKPKGAICIRFW